jgi:hypothetical protein
VAILRFLGEGKKAEALAVELNKKLDSIPPHRQAFTRRAMEYSAGRLSADELLHGSAGSRGQLCSAHFFIGVLMLAVGDRNKAREHFEQVLLTRADSRHEWDFSWAFLGRMADDPEWPTWIPAKK